MVREDACRVSVRAQRRERPGEGVKPAYTGTNTEIYQGVKRFLLAMVMHRITVTASGRELRITLFCSAISSLSYSFLSLSYTQDATPLKVLGRFFYSYKKRPLQCIQGGRNPSLIPSYILVITPPLYSPPTYPSTAHSCPFVGIYIFVPWTTPGTPVGQDLVRRPHGNIP